MISLRTELVAIIEDDLVVLNHHYGIPEERLWDFPEPKDHPCAYCDQLTPECVKCFDEGGIFNGN